MKIWIIQKLKKLINKESQFNMKMKRIKKIVKEMKEEL